MRVKSGSLSVLWPAVLGAVIAVLCPGWIEGSELSATHLVYEKAVKMKKVDASIFLPFLDQSRKSDNSQRSRQVHCVATAESKGRSLPVKGKFHLRLLGKSNGIETPWESRVLVGSVDDNGEVLFGSEEILGLAAEAAGVEIGLFQVDFDGGKGKKVSSLTVDCLHQGDAS